MTIKAELSYLEFHNTKDKLGSGFYLVVEVDGDLSYARVKASDWGGPALVKWLSEDEYLDLCRHDQEIIDSLDISYVARHYINHDDMAETDANNNSELFDLVVFGIEPTDGEDSDLKNKYPPPVKSLGDILREYMQPDIRQMDEAQYAEHCESVDQDRRDGVML